MPKVKIFTLIQNKRRDAIAKRLKQKGYSESRSYAIATSNVKKTRRKKR